jgi:predicted RNA polymerase sigma factor
MDASAALVKVLREEGLRVLATLVRYLGDLPVADDALSEATIAALEAWPASGIPDNPRAWLTVVARRTAAASVPSPRREVRARLTNSRAAGVLYWFRRSSLQ